jgi:phosphate transport system substrate-binding protein
MINFIKQAAVAVLAIGLTAGAASAEIRLQGSGATFPAPVYQRWVSEFQKVHPDVQIDYQAIGSGGGIKALTDKTVDFAGSDAPMSKKEIAAAGGHVVHIPTVAGAVVVAFNLPGFTGDLKLSGPVVANMFLGKITKWNDPAIAAMNPGVNLPDLAITPVNRTDASGTNFIFTNYLCTQSPDFKDNVGAGKSVQWPAGGQGGKGSDGVTAIVKSTPGCVAYTEQNYADKNNIPTALMQNKNGKFVKASPDTVSAAGGGAVGQMGDSLAVNIWDQPGDNAYPISSFTYIIVQQDLSGLGKDKSDALVAFLTWATHDGEKLAPDMDYAPLAPEVQKKVDEAIAGLKK